MKINRLIIVVYLVVGISTDVSAGPFVLLDEQALSTTQARLAAGTAPPATREAYSRLLQQADKWLESPNFSVLDKTSVPPSGDRHDYLSLSRYWWPNPNTADGLPWIRRDGMTNPDTQTGAVDRVRFGKMATSVRILSLAYYFSGNEAYAAKAASILKTWFLDEKTRMNPHLKFAQSVPGNPEIRATGILDGRLISVSVLDGLVLLANSPHWPAEEDADLDLWLRQYLDWLTGSPTGKRGALQENNHGSWYRFQVAALAWYLGDSGLVSDIMEVARRSLDEQLDAAGGQPHELERTRSFSYSCFNLEALTGLAIIDEKAGGRFWEYQSPQGKSLSLAIDYLLPFARGEVWPHPTSGVDLSRLAPILARLPERFMSQERSEVLQSILGDVRRTEHRSRRVQSMLDEFALLQADGIAPANR